MAIVVIDEDRDGSFEMLAIQDEQPVETFISDRSHEKLGHSIRLRARNGVRTISICRY